ncbi:hypothetical protein Gpo141_00007685 [Globisporangium polare]
MGATCSSCCCSDRRDSDVALEENDASALQQKLLDAGDYDHDGGNGTMLTDDSRGGNPFSHSDSRMKASWPRPAVTPTSGYVDYDVHDDDGDTDQSGYCDRSDTTSEHDSRHSSNASSAARSPSVQLAWNLREGGTSFVASSELLDDGNDDGGSGMGSALRSDRVLSAAQSERSVASDSYASTRELSTYESLLFADDAAAKSNDSVQNDGEDDDDGDGDRDGDDDAADDDSAVMFFERQPSSSSSLVEGSSPIERAVLHRKRSK